MFARGAADEFHVWRLGRFYWCKKENTPANRDYFVKIGNFYFLRIPRDGKYNRWSDRDIAIGNMVFCKGDSKNYAFKLESKCEDSEDSHCTLLVEIGKYDFRWTLPNIIKPFRVKKKASYWSEEHIKQVGRDWYWEDYRRVYGFSCHEGHFSFYYGIQNDRGFNDKIKTRRWGCFLPWTQWRFVRHSLWNADGELFYEYKHKKNTSVAEDKTREAKELCSAVYFLIKDYDNKEIVVKTYIEEREWLFGEKWCSWLSFFRKPMIRRDVDIAFAEEVGTQKGSWKGGLMGTSIKIQPNETHEDGFRRYCAIEHRDKGGKYRITFIRRVDPSELIELVPAKCSW